MTIQSFDPLNARVDPRLGTYQPVPPFDVMGLFLGLWRGKWVILLTTICAILLAGYYAFTQTTPTYAATATITFERGNRGSEDDSSGEVTQTHLNTQAAILRSRHILEQVIVALDLENDPAVNRYLVPVTPWSISGLRDSLRARVVGQENAPITPQDLRDKTVENLAEMLQTGPQRGTYILAVTATTTSPQRSQAIANAVAQTYLADQIDARIQATETTVTRLSQRVSQLQINLQDQEAAINALLASGQMTDESLFDQLSQRANAAAQRLAEAQQSQSARDNQQIDALQALHARLNAQLASQSAGLITLQQLRREAQSTRALYTNLLAQLQQIQGAYASDPSNARILSPAAPGHYVAPRKTYILTAAAILGAVFGAFNVIFQQHRHVQCAGFTGRTGWPVSAHFPAMPARKNKPPTRPAQDAANQLRAAVLAQRAKGAQVILSTSCENNAVYQRIAWALAQSLARIDRTVLFIDAVQSQIADAPTSPHSIADIVYNSAPFPAASNGAAVTCLRAFADGGNAADLFSSAGFARFLNQARQAFDHIVVHSAGIAQSPDAQVLAAGSDAVVVTLRDHKTRRRDWENAQAKLHQVAYAPQILIAFTN